MEPAACLSGDQALEATSADIVRYRPGEAFILGRSAFVVRWRMPFWLIPGDLLAITPVLAFTNPRKLKKMGMQSANGGLIPWQTGIATRVGRFEFVLGRENRTELLWPSQLRVTSSRCGAGQPDCRQTPVNRVGCAHCRMAHLPHVFMGPEFPFGDPVLRRIRQADQFLGRGACRCTKAESAHDRDRRSENSVRLAALPSLIHRQARRSPTRLRSSFHKPRLSFTTARFG